MGGMISQSLAIRHPHRVASLTSIMSNTGDRRHGRVHRSLLRTAPRYQTRDPADARGERHEDVPADLRAALRRRGGAGHARGVARPQRRHRRCGPPDDGHHGQPGPDVGPAVGSQAPTLVVHGLLDRLVMPSGGIATAQAIPGSRLVMYPDMGHDLPRPRWDEVIEEIVAQHAAGRRRRPASRRGSPDTVVDRRAPGPGRPRRRGRAAAGDLDRRRRADRHRRSCAGRPVTSPTTTC